MKRAQLKLFSEVKWTQFKLKIQQSIERDFQLSEKWKEPFRLEIIKNGQVPSFWIESKLYDKDWAVFLPFKTTNWRFSPISCQFVFFHFYVWRLCGLKWNVHRKQSIKFYIGRAIVYVVHRRSTSIWLLPQYSTQVKKCSDFASWFATARQCW